MPQSVANKARTAGLLLATLFEKTQEGDLGKAAVAITALRTLYPEVRFVMTLGCSLELFTDPGGWERLPRVLQMKANYVEEVYPDGRAKIRKTRLVIPVLELERTTDPFFHWATVPRKTAWEVVGTLFED